MIVADSHPALPGHFPGMPVVPGVVLLSELLGELSRQRPEFTVHGIRKLKFLRMLLPGQQFHAEFGQAEFGAGAGATPAAGRLRFKCWIDSELLAEGHLAVARRT